MCLATVALFLSSSNLTRVAFLENVENIRFFPPTRSPECRSCYHNETGEISATLTKCISRGYRTGRIFSRRDITLNAEQLRREDDKRKDSSGLAEDDEPPSFDQHTTFRSSAVRRVRTCSAQATLVARGSYPENSLSLSLCRWKERPAAGRAGIK